MKKILLLQPLHEKQKLTKSRRNFTFPYGLGYLAVILRDNDYEVEILDAHAEQLSKKEVFDSLGKKDFDILGISAFSTQYNAVKKISFFVKNKLKKKVIVGGPLATYSYDLTLKNCAVDACILGEGEKTIIELLNNLDNKDNLIKVKGIAFKKDGQIIKTPDREYISNLDDLPKPAYDLFDMEKYLHANLFETQFVEFLKNKKYRNKRIIHFITSRGCPYKCRFCSRNYGSVRFMSVDKIIKELKYLKDKFKIDGVHFSDELFVLSKDRMREFAEKVKPLNLFWDAQARVNLADYEILKIMKGGGCTGVGFGIESGSQKILNNINKASTVEQIERAMAAAKKLNLGVKVQLIFGYPGEDENTIKETIEMFKRIDHPGRRFVHITPIPGSPLYEECVSKGLIKDEDKYLTSLEKSFGTGNIFVNFTNWTDEEVLKKMHETEEIILNNYIHRNLFRFLAYKYGLFNKLLRSKHAGLKRRVIRWLEAIKEVVASSAKKIELM